MSKNPIRFIRKRWNRFKFYYIDAKGIRSQSDGKRTLFIMINSLGGGGAQRVACVLASELVRKYHVVMLIFNKHEHPYPLDEHVKVLRIPWRGMTQKGLLKCLDVLKKRMRAVATISFMFDCNEKNLQTRSFGKVICTERNNPKKKDPVSFPETENQYRAADHVVFQSEAVRNLYDETVKAHSSILPNPVSVTCYASDKKQHKVVAVGRLHPQKNQKMLIRAFAAFAEDHPGYSLDIYGDGEMEGELRQLSADLGIGNKVVFHGTVTDVCSEIADAEMFVLSSDYEGLSNALLEAMMMGIPCISTACEGSVDVIRSGENGILTPVGDETALTGAMRELADNKPLRESIAKAGSEIHKTFDKAIVAEQWVEVIEKVTQ